MKAVFSARFKAELLDAEAKYCEVSDRLAGELPDRRAKSSVGKAAITSDLTGFRAAGQNRFRFSFTTKRGATRFTFSAWFTNDATPIF